jgi:EEF1A lysine methyltransferase 4
VQEAAFTTTGESALSPPPKESAVAEVTTAFPDRDKTRVLILGCGDSTFGADMLHDGWTGGILNLDFSQVVIAQMKLKYAVYAGRLDYACADITKPLNVLATGSFDLIVSKGSLDAVLCSPGSRASALAMVSECTRLLAPGHGVFFLVSAGNPDSRLEFLEYQNELSHYWRGVSVHPLLKDDVSATRYKETDKK